MMMETARHAAENMERPSTYSAIYELTSRQHGVASLAQLVEVSSRWVIRRALERRHLVAIDERVVRANGAQWTERSRAMAAVLSAGPGAMVSHTSAAAMWGIEPFRIDPLQLMVGRGVGRGHNPVTSCLATVHRQRSLAAIPRCLVDGVPLVRPEVVVLQLCGTLHPARAERALDAFWRDALLSGPSISALLDRIATRGLSGVRLLRSLLADRPSDYVPPTTGLEARFAQILRRANLPAMARQRDLGDDENWCGRVDFSDSVLPIIVEVDSEKFHTALVDVRYDAARQRRLEQAGFTVARVTDHQVWHRPSEVVEVVRRLRADGAARR